MREASAAVEESSDRVREERASGHRPGYHVSLLNELARQQIDQILRKTPDRRRMPEQLVSVHVQPPVIPIAIIEMAAEHQHFRMLKVLQRLGANLRASIHQFS